MLLQYFTEPMGRRHPARADSECTCVYYASYGSRSPPRDWSRGCKRVEPQIQGPPAHLGMHGLQDLGSEIPSALIVPYHSCWRYAPQQKAAAYGVDAWSRYHLLVVC